MRRCRLFFCQRPWLFSGRDDGARSLHVSLFFVLDASSRCKLQLCHPEPLTVCTVSFPLFPTPVVILLGGGQILIQRDEESKDKHPVMFYKKLPPKIATMQVRHARQ